MEKLYLLAQALNSKYPEGNEPFQIGTRILEECGEVASAINHFEKTGIKTLKHGEPEKKNMAKEVMQALTSLTQLVLYYGIEDELKEAIENSAILAKFENL